MRVQIESYLAPHSIMTSQMESRLQACLDACMTAGCPGAILVVDAPRLGVAFSGASGVFERGHPRPLRPADRFRAASVTKAVTAATAVRLSADGNWSLDDPITSFLAPDVVEALRGLDGLKTVDALTIRRLLSHTSGLPDYFFDPRFQARVQEDPERHWKPAELITAAVDVGQMLFEPGSGFSYGDTGYVLVGLAIERLLDCSLADACRSLIFDPLSMDATYLEWHEEREESEISHHYDGAHDLTTMNTSFDWAGGGLVTTGGDLARFLRGLFGGAIAEKAWVEEMTRWRDELQWRPDSSARYRRYGLGIGLNLASGEEIVGATGVWGAFAYYWPAGDAAIAGTVNLRGVDRASLLDSVIRALLDSR